MAGDWDGGHEVRAFEALFNVIYSWSAVSYSISARSI